MTPEPVPSYEIKDGIRYVKPYLQDIKTTVKTRWLRRTVLDILSSEFRSFDAAEYKKRMENNDIAVLHHVKLTKKERKELKEKNLPKSKHLKRIVFPEIMSYKMEDNDVIDRLEHIHERSVIALNSENVEVIFENDDILVVNKPSGIPIHPVQNYFYNSFVKVLEIEGWPGRKESVLAYQLRPCYRLDKLTSGVCIFAKSTQVARNIQMQIQNRDVEKVYLARVKGKFPAESDIECLDDVIVIDTKKGKQDGIMRKSARTIFQFVGYNKNLDESIVMCYPKTGRTHQIRIHLRNLNHPIINDPLYGPNKLMCLRENQTPNEISDEYFEMIKSQATLNRIEVESNECCEICNIKLFKQSPKEDLTMYLHAYKYKLNGSDGWSYQTTWPEWCNI
jgi:RluA family pseudouridine synthase